jgi:peptide/nickel transport system ATP-binding protein
MHGIAMIFITHDISAARRLSDRMIVLDKGEIVESGITLDISSPHHAVTKALLSASSNEEQERP